MDRGWNRGWIREERTLGLLEDWGVAVPLLIAAVFWASAMSTLSLRCMLVEAEATEAAPLAPALGPELLTLQSSESGAGGR